MRTAQPAPCAMTEVGNRGFDWCLFWELPYTHAPRDVPLTRARTVATNVLEENMLMIGNVLEVRDAAGRPVMAMSTRAYDAFSPEQRAAILKHVHAIHHAPVDMLEHVGGGGVRCTLAEIFR